MEFNPTLTVKLIYFGYPSSEIFKKCPLQFMLEDVIVNNNEGKLKYKNIEFITDEDKQADYYIIINYPSPNHFFEPSRTIIFHNEPWCYEPTQPYGVKTWKNIHPNKYHFNIDWSYPQEIKNETESLSNCCPEMCLPGEGCEKSKFLKVFTPQNCSLGLVQWMFALSPSYLLSNSPQKVTIKYRHEVICPNEKISAIVSERNNDPGQKARLSFINRFKQHFGITVFGRNCPITPNYGELTPEEKYKGYFPYKYFISAENNREPNYITEKLFEPIICECLTFYDGAPNAHHHIDPRAFIVVDLQNNPEQAYTIIFNAIRNKEWEKRIDVIRQEKKRIITELSFFPKVYDTLVEKKFTFLQRTDQFQNDIFRDNSFSMKNKLNENVHAYNTVGFFKDKITNLKYLFNDPKQGLYIKYLSLLNHLNNQIQKFDWITPVITEKTFFQQYCQVPGYIPFPWNIWLDSSLLDPVKYSNKLPSDKELIENYFSPLINFYIQNFNTKVFFTCCQSISFRKIIPFLKVLNIPIVLYASHKIKGEDRVSVANETQGVENVILKPCPLFAVNYEDPDRNDILVNKKLEKKYLFSFQGGLQSNYMTDIRKRIFNEFESSQQENIHVKNTGQFHLNKATGFKGINQSDDSLKNDLKEYNRILLQSTFSLCPSGAGPNSIRLWESLAVGSIPVLFIGESEPGKGKEPFLDLPSLEGGPEDITWENSIVFFEGDLKDLEKYLNDNFVKTHLTETMSKNCKIIYNYFKNDYASILKEN